MNGFWWIIFANWTLEERVRLRAFADAFVAADHSQI
jgi:hypothetical protein